MGFVWFTKISSTFDGFGLLIFFAILHIIFSFYRLFFGWYVILNFQLIESFKRSSYILLIVLILSFIPFLNLRLLMILKILWFHWLLRLFFEQEFRIVLHLNGISLFKLVILLIGIIRIRKLVNFLLVHLLYHKLLIYIWKRKTHFVIDLLEVYKKFTNVTGHELFLFVQLINYKMSEILKLLFYFLNSSPIS